MKPLPCWLLSALLLPSSPLIAADKAAAPVLPVQPAAAQANAKPKTSDKSSGSQWVFSILPKSLQKNPRVEMTVITEVTDDGKKLAEVTPQHPVYYLGQSAGFHSLGRGPANEKAPPPEALAVMLKNALAPNGYLPAEPGQPVGLLVVYSWGSHYALHPEEDETISAETVMANILDRAALVGGPKLAQELQKLLEQKAALLEANPPARPGPGGLVPGIDPILGPDQQAFVDPIRGFTLESTKNAFVIEQAFDDVYYVVASAYDYPAIGRGQRILLWRTRMTVDAKGVAMADTIPTLIDTAAPYFGKEMDEPETLVKRALKEGTVEVGTPTVVAPGKESSGR